MIELLIMAGNLHLLKPYLLTWIGVGPANPHHKAKPTPLERRTGTRATEKEKVRGRG